MPGKRILSIGQCAADHASITRAIQGYYHAEVVSAHTAQEALAQLHQGRFDLVLINRILDADGSSGFDVLRALKADASSAALPVMLVSNYEEYQQQAVTLGAVPGFGKNALTQARTRACLEPFLR